MHAHRTLNDCLPDTVGASGERTVSSSGSSTNPTEAASGAPAAPRELHPQPVAVIVAPISPIDRVIDVPGNKTTDKAREGRPYKFDTHTHTEELQWRTGVSYASG